jgi:hypothetical protein
MLVFQFIAVLAATLFTGAAIYINVAEHPARMEWGTAVAAKVFGPSYRRAAVMQAVLALVFHGQCHRRQVHGRCGGMAHRGAFDIRRYPVHFAGDYAHKQEAARSGN